MANTKKEKSIEWLIKNYMPFFETFGINEQNLRSYYQEWKIEFSDNIYDFLWHIFNTLLNENASQSKDVINFYKRNERIYTEMISFRRRIEKKPANELHKIWNKNRLELTYESSNLEMDIMISVSKDCEYFEKLNNKILSFKEALKNDIIPYEHCQREQGCVCGFLFQPKRDETGSLIRKEIKN